MAIIVGFLSLVTGCGSEGGHAAATASLPVTLHYPNGRIMAVGAYEAGTTTRTGSWSDYYDLPGSPQQWQRQYVHGRWASDEAWREWNVDGSVRNDGSDH